MQRSPLYTIVFATIVCIVCAIVVSSAAVSLKERQDANAFLEKQRNVLKAAGLLEEGEVITEDEVKQRFSSIDSIVINLETGEVAEEIDPATYDQLKASKSPDSSRPAPDNRALVRRVPLHALVYEVRDDAGALEMVVLPIEGKGLWSTLYGFLALESDLRTVGGITFYEHKETPGLGGEVDNPGWKAKWPGRLAYDDEGKVALRVIKGRAGKPEEDPYRVDGLSGATLTARGVGHLVKFWLDDEIFGPYLTRLGNAGPAEGGVG